MQALKKVEDQLTCAICLDAYKDPKLLQCFHVYCQDCLQRLVVQDGQGKLSLRCPTCRQSTVLPPLARDVSDLQSAFHIHHLFEIQDALEKVKEPHKVKCDKCKTPQQATSYCRDCGEFICTICTTVHREWVAFDKHDVVALEQLESKIQKLDALNKVTMYCPLHQGKELELYCETCEELICHNCTVKKHKEHRYDLVEDTFERHEAEITASLESVEVHHSNVGDALVQLNLRSQELKDQRAANEANIWQEIQQLIEILQARAVELINQQDQHFQMKMKNLEAQKDELETIQTQLASCLSFVKDSLRTGSKGEIMKMKSTVMKQIKVVADNVKPDMLPPCEPANVAFTSSPLTQACQQFGEIYLETENCCAIAKALEMAELGERDTAVLHVVDHKGKANTTSMPLVDTLSSELVSEYTGKKTHCSVKKTETGQYEIKYQATNRGKHQLHIKVGGEHIKGSPFPLTVKLPIKKLGTPIKTISDVKWPRGVAVNQRGEILAAEGNRHCVSIFSLMGERVQSFGSRGSGNGQFNGPRGVTIDSNGNILVMDMDNHRVQKFTSDGKFIMAIGSKGSKPLEFNRPVGITVHPQNEKVYVADCSNHRVQILNPDPDIFKHIR